jgi:hypothetical protein
MNNLMQKYAYEKKWYFSKYKLHTMISSAQATLSAITDCGIYFSRIFFPPFLLYCFGTFV